MIKIHGKDYVTVAERVAEAGKDFLSLSTEVLFQSPVVIKATVTTKKGTFTGISAANPSKSIEKMSPYEVAETSAVGRALGFAGYGAVDSIASADEMVKSQEPTPDPTDEWDKPQKEATPVSTGSETSVMKMHFCTIHNKELKQRVNTKSGGHFYDHRMKIDEVWNVCDGSGYKAQ